MSPSEAFFVTAVTTGKILIELSINEKYLGTEVSKKAFLVSIKKVEENFFELRERMAELSNDGNSTSYTEFDCIERNLKAAISRVEESLVKA